MHNLTKIKEISSKYGISARTLRYYEDMGLLTSIRSDEYAYRLYDEATVKKLEQILILRKLNINIKDIRRIFDSSDSKAVLDILSKKVEDIDGEVSLLHELKEIIFAFIRYIKKADFNKETDVKMLYDKAKEIETQIANVKYEGCTDVNLKEMVVTYFDDEPEGGYKGEYSFTDQGELVIASKGFEEWDFIGLQTNERFRLPLRMDVIAKSDSEIWLHYNQGGLALNHDTDGSYYLHANDIFTGMHVSYPMKKLSLDEYTEISWVLDYSEANIYVNGEHFHTHVWRSAMPYEEKTKILSPVDVTAGNANTVTVKSIKVTETQIATSDMNRLLEVTEKYNQRLHNESVLVINLPKSKAVTSGWQWWDELFKEGSFAGWVNKNPHLHKEAFLGHHVYFSDKNADFHHDKACMNITVHDNVTAADAAPYELIDFEGGLYAALHYPVGSEYCDEMYRIIMKWLENTNFEYDETRYLLAMDIYGACEDIEKGLGCRQLLRCVPIKLRTQ